MGSLGWASSHIAEVLLKGVIWTLDTHRGKVTRVERQEEDKMTIYNLDNA